MTQALISIPTSKVPSFTSRVGAIDQAVSQEILAFGRSIGGNLALVANL